MSTTDVNCDHVEDKERGNPVLRSRFDNDLKEIKVGEASDGIFGKLLKKAGKVVLKNLGELICRMRKMRNEKCQ